MDALGDTIECFLLGSLGMALYKLPSSPLKRGDDAAERTESWVPKDVDVFSFTEGTHDFPLHRNRNLFGELGISEKIEALDLELSVDDN